MWSRRSDIDEVWSRWDKRVRDSIIFLVGVVGCIHELFIVPDPRPASLVFLASLIGVPFVLSADESKSGQKSGKKDGKNKSKNREPDDEQ